MNIVKNIVRTEPAVLLGSLGAAITWAIEELSTAPGETISWAAVAPLLAAGAIRQFVFSPSTLQHRLDETIDRVVTEMTANQKSNKALAARKRSVKKAVKHDA